MPFLSLNANMFNFHSPFPYSGFYTTYYIHILMLFFVKPKKTIMKTLLPLKHV